MIKQEISLKIILEDPPAGVDFGLQKGSGGVYETLQKQRSGKGDLHFEFKIIMKPGTDAPDFGGPLVQGPVGGRFIYIDIGTYAGQTDTPWGRRLKVPLREISEAMIQQLINHPDKVLETKVPGTGKDGFPNCGTVKPFGGWEVI